MQMATESVLHQAELGGPNARLSPSDLRRYGEDGAILVRNLFTAAEYKPVCNDLADRVGLLETSHGLVSGPACDDVPNISARILALIQAAPQTQTALYDAMDFAPALHRLASDPKLLSVVRSLLSPSIAIHKGLIP